MIKTCSKCKQDYSLEYFIKNKSCKNGYANICKKCSNIYNKKWKRKNSERLAIDRRRRYAETDGLEVTKRS